MTIRHRWTMAEGGVVLFVGRVLGRLPLNAIPGAIALGPDGSAPCVDATADSPDGGAPMTAP